MSLFCDKNSILGAALKLFPLKSKLYSIMLFRFGQVSPRPTDKIPPLDFKDKQSKQNGDLHDKSERTPVPPM